MADKHPKVLDFLRSRRSRPAKILTAPVPDRAEIEQFLQMAARTPDHKKLEPWRFVVLEKPAMPRLAELAAKTAAKLGKPVEKIEKFHLQFANADLVVAVVFSPVPHADVPETEQVLSAGAVCLALLNAALASGWGANWLTGPMAFDAEFLQSGLGLQRHEFVAGFIHIGTAKSIPPDRPRPDMAAKTTWISS